MLKYYKKRLQRVKVDPVVFKIIFDSLKTNIVELSKKVNVSRVTLTNFKKGKPISETIYRKIVLAYLYKEIESVSTYKKEIKSENILDDVYAVKELSGNTTNIIFIWEKNLPKKYHKKETFLNDLVGAGIVIVILSEIRLPYFFNITIPVEESIPYLNDKLTTDYLLKVLMDRGYEVTLRKLTKVKN